MAWKMHIFHSMTCFFHRKALEFWGLVFFITLLFACGGVSQKVSAPEDDPTETETIEEPMIEEEPIFQEDENPLVVNPDFIKTRSDDEGSSEETPAASEETPQTTPKENEEADSSSSEDPSVSTATPPTTQSAKPKGPTQEDPVTSEREMEKAAERERFRIQEERIANIKLIEGIWEFTPVAKTVNKWIGDKKVVEKGRYLKTDEDYIPLKTRFRFIILDDWKLGIEKVEEVPAGTAGVNRPVPLYAVVDLSPEGFLHLTDDSPEEGSDYLESLDGQMITLTEAEGWFTRKSDKDFVVEEGEFRLLRSLEIGFNPIPLGPLPEQTRPKDDFLETFPLLKENENLLDEALSSKK